VNVKYELGQSLLAADERRICVNLRLNMRLVTEWLEDIRERPVALRNAAASGRSEALVWATAIVASHRPHRESGDVAVCIRKVQQRLRIGELKDLSVDVVDSDHGSHSDTCGQAGGHHLIMRVARGLLCAESHLTSIIVR
jgi:hypothetical protein